jgi:hypothetical protein
MHVLRKVVFYLFLLLYVVATPLVILYALGYQIRPGQREALVRTGLISLNTSPEGARVFLGNRRYRWKTPTVLRDLRAGDYAIRLTLRDHQPWTAQVRVEAEKATVLDHLLLLPTTPVIRSTSTNRFETLYPGPGEQEFLLSTGPLAGELAVCDTLRATVTPLLPKEDPFAEARVVRLHQVPDNPCLLLEVERAGHTAYGWRRLDVEKELTADITSLFPSVPRFLTWDVRERDDIFSMVQDRINRLDLDDRALYPDLVRGVQAMAADRGDLVILDQSNRLYRTRRDGEGKPERLGTSPAEAKLAWASTTGYELFPVNNQVVFLRGVEGELFVNQPPYQLLTRDHRGTLLHPSDQLAVVWDDHRLGRYVYEEEKTPDPAAPPAGVVWFFTSPRSVDQVFWCHEASHLLVAGEGQLDLVALESAGGPSARTLLNFAPDTRVFYSERAGAVYYLEPDTRQLMERQLLPRFELLNLGRGRIGTNQWDQAKP